MELEPLWRTFLTGWGVVATIMLILWWRQLSTKNATSVDVAWAANLGILAILGACLLSGWAPRRYLAAGMMALSAFRLASHLIADRLRGAKEEDGRYATLRREKGSGAAAWFFVFYQAQALLDALLVLPILLAARAGPPHWTVFDAAGVTVWVVALVCESLADRQLAAWKRRPENKGKTCRHGLWSVSRHPNYFFEWLTWVAYALMATPTPAGALGWVPAGLMLFFILKVTGIPPTEAQACKSRPDYARYQQEVSAFFPWFPKRSAR